MGERDERVEQLAAQVSELAERVARLEGGGRDDRRSPPSTGPDLEFVLGLLRGRAGGPYEAGDTRGAVAYAGVVRFGTLEYDWDVERPVPGLMAAEEEPLARTLAALASPPRLRLIRALLRGPRSTQELQEALGNVSTGQFYHHLKELLSARLVIQKGRSLYAIGAHHIVPLLAMLAVAQDLTDLAGEEPT